MIILAAVVGVLLLAGLVAGAVLYLRHRRRVERAWRKEQERKEWTNMRFWATHRQFAPTDVKEIMAWREWAGQPPEGPEPAWLRQEREEREARAQAERAEQERQRREDEARREADRQERLKAARAFMAVSRAYEASKAPKAAPAAPQPQVPAPAPPAPPERLTEAPAPNPVSEPRKAVVHGQTWEARVKKEVRSPSVCEWDGCDVRLPWNHPAHHWSYDREDSYKDFSYYCDKHHAKANRERRIREGSTAEWGDVRCMEAINFVYRKGWTWHQVAAHYGLTYRQVYGRCKRRFPDHPVFKEQTNKAVKPGGKTAQAGKTRS